MNDTKNTIFLICSIVLAIAIILSIYFQSAAGISIVGLLMIGVFAVAGFIYRNQNHWKQ